MFGKDGLRFFRASSGVMPEGGGPGVAAQSDSRAAQEGLPARGVIEELSGAFISARTALTDFLDLLSLEARRAGLSLMWMVVCGVIAAVCIVSAWLGLMLALAISAVSLGCPPLLAVLAIALLNGAAGAALIYRGIRISGDLRFPATRRQLAGNAMSVTP